MINLTKQNYGNEILLVCESKDRNEVEQWYNRAFNYNVTNSDLDLVEGQMDILALSSRNFS